MQNARILMMILILNFGAAGTTLLFSLQKSGEPGTPDAPKGNLQRSAEILYFKRFAESGSERVEIHPARRARAFEKALPFADRHERGIHVKNEQRTSCHLKRRRMGQLKQQGRPDICVMHHQSLT